MSRIKKIIVYLTVLITLVNTGAFNTQAAVAEPQITASNAILIHLDTGLVMYKKNADEKIYPGFLTKVMTALVVTDKVKDFNEKATVGKDFLQDINYRSSLNFKEGEQISVKDLLYCMLVSTSNEAANILAQHVSSSNKQFALLMTEKARALGAVNTHFSNPHGIDDKEAYTTANDAAIIIKSFINDSELMNIADTTYYKTGPTNLTPERKLYTTNYILLSSTPYYMKYSTGIKNSYDREHGYALSTLSERKNYKILSLVFGCPKTTKNGVSTIHSFTDTKILINWAMDSFVTKKLLTENEPCAQITVNLSKKYDSVTLVSPTDFKTLMPKEYDNSKLEFKPSIPESIDAPVEKGQKIGTMDIIYNGTVLGTIDLNANYSIKVDMLLYYGNQINKFFNNIWVILACSLIIILFIVYVVYTIIYNKRRPNYRSVKRRLRF